MKTNRQTHSPLVTLSRRILAVIDDGAAVRDAVRELADAGIPEYTVATLSGEEGLQRLNADGKHGGRLMRVMRAFQSMNAEGAHLRRYEAEVEHGRWVVDVPIPAVAHREDVVTILRAHGGHFINAYNPWTVEQVAA